MTARFWTRIYCGGHEQVTPARYATISDLGAYLRFEHRWDDPAPLVIDLGPDDYEVIEGERSKDCEQLERIV